MDEQIYTLSGLHCESCVEKVHRRLRSHPKVARVEVTRDPDQARVAAMDGTTLQVLNAWLVTIGEYQLSVVGEPVPVAVKPPQSAPVAVSSRFKPSSSLPAAASAGTGPGPAMVAAGAAARPAGVGNRRVDTAGAERSRPSGTPAWLVTYKPLLLVFGYILLTVIGFLAATGSWDGALAMRLFMAGFFLVFSFFKFLDVAGFASAFRGYDLVARVLPGYGRAYPFIELVLGLAYLTNIAPAATNIATAIIMAVGLAGIIRAVVSKQSIRCACLGTGINLPMSTVTIIENSVMLVMAVASALG
jgi:copper chaperone CopZ